MLKNKKIAKFVKISCVLAIVVILGIISIKGYWADEHTVENYDIDLVYLWCNGSEPEFLARKNYWLQQENKPAIQAAADGRWEQVDELKYSLRSVDQYIPWVRHIYVVTDRQVPVWLKTDNPKLTVVDHSEIIPQKYIPVFNSNAIESSIHKVPGLAEHFLFSNDDTFVNRPLEKVFFFRHGKPIFRMKPTMLNPESLYQAEILHTIEVAEQDFGGEIPFFSRRNLVPHHNIDAYLKSDYASCVQHFEKEYEKTLTHRFRKPDCIQRIIVAIWSLMKGNGHLKVVYTRKKKSRKIDSLYISNTRRDYKDKLDYLKPALFCLNDGEFSTPEDRAYLKEFLEKRFPKKSQFEK